MSIETASVNRITLSDLAEPVRAPISAIPRAAAESAPTPEALASAVRDLQSAIDKGPNPSFTLDYLSGLSVVTVRSNITGEVVFQLPDTRAVELARLLKEGASLGELGLLHTEA
jgi:uncharacterized FlaG/YvyC family protein